MSGGSLQEAKRQRTVNINKKCLFKIPELEFVGYKLDTTGISPLPRKLEAKASFPSPQKQKHLLLFLWAINYYHRSLPHHNSKSPAAVQQPLYEIATRKTATKVSFSKQWEIEGVARICVNL